MPGRIRFIVIATLALSFTLCDSATSQPIQFLPPVMLDTTVGRSYVNPSIIADSDGVLIYAIQQTATDTTLVGFKIDALSQPESYTSLGTILTTGRVLDGWLGQSGGFHILLWRADRRLDSPLPPMVDSVYFYLTTFQSDRPAPAELAGSILLDKWQTSSRPMYLWDARFARTDSLLYFEFTTGQGLLETVYEVHIINAVNLISRQVVSLQSPPHNSYPLGHFAGGRSDFVRTSSGIALVEPVLFCWLYFHLEQRCFHPEVRYNEHSILGSAVADSGVAVDSVYIADEYSWYDVRRIANDTAQYFTFRGARDIRRFNPQTDRFEFVNSVPASEHQNLLPVILPAGTAIVVTSWNGGGDHLELYDQSWNHVGSDSINYSGDSVRNIWATGEPGSSAFAVCYTSVGAEPYHQRRLFVQTGTADVPTDVASDIPEQLPSGFSLSQNYPNPFNGQSTLTFALPATNLVTLRIYNGLGRLIRTLATKEFPAGTHRLVWDGRTDDGDNAASGIYFYRLTTSSFDSTKKMLLLK